MSYFFRLLFFSSLLFLFSHASANDSTFMSQGDTLHPLVESDISIEKEELSIKVPGNEWEVEVYFEFFNPGKKRDILVGFTAPRPSGPGEWVDWGDGSQPKKPDYNKLLSRTESHYRNFTVTLNGKAVEHKLIQAKDLNFKKWNLDPEIINKEYDMVFIFPAVFKKGKNIITHTYQTDGDVTAGSTGEIGLGYTLQTGRLWAGGAIKDFTLRIAGSKDMVFAEEYWLPKMTLKGKAKGDPREDIYIGGMLVYEGYLEFKAKDFVPEKDIYLQAKLARPMNGMFERLTHKGRGYNIADCIEAIDDENKPGENNSWEEDCGLGRFGRETLRLFRNYPYAVARYAFESENLRNFFMKEFAWYFPDPSIKISDIDLSPNEKEFIQRVREAEKK